MTNAQEKSTNENLYQSQVFRCENQDAVKTENFRNLQKQKTFFSEIDLSDFIEFRQCISSNIDSSSFDIVNWPSFSATNSNKFAIIRWKSQISLLFRYQRRNSR